MNKNKVINMFKNLDREAFADWLWRGLRSFYNYSSEGELWISDYTGSLIRRQDAVSEGIKQLYLECIPPEKQLQFRQAIGDVMRVHTNDGSLPIHAYQDLLYLIAGIRADESLPALLPAIGNGLAGKANPDILYDTFSVLKYMAPSIHAYSAASTLAKCRNFDEGYLFEALTVMVECEPTLTVKMILLYEPRLTEHRKLIHQLNDVNEIDVFNEVADTWAKHVFKYAPNTWLCDLWGDACHTTEQIWLFELLFCNSEYPIYLDFDKCVLHYYGKPIPIEFSDKDYWTRRHITGLHTYRNAVDQDYSNLDDTVNDDFISSNCNTADHHYPRLGDRVREGIKKLH